MTRILVVEDEVHIQRLIKLILTKSNFEVDICTCGEDALEFLKDEKNKPDLMLLDILMPGMDGLQVLKSVKGFSHMSEVPIILLTALAQENIVMEGVKLGARDYIRKPFHPKDLVSRLSKHLTA